ncbi:MAG: iron ABC transporter permease [Planctomycetota bacterium]|nr:iron ABC transporter permease [Planctomycetota bacterium]
MRPSSRNIGLALAVSLPLIAYICYPTLATLWDGLREPVAEWRAQRHGFPAEQPAGAAFRALIKENSARKAVWGTLTLSFWTVVCGGLWGLGLAFLWGRRAFPGRRLFAMLGYAPILMPPLVGTLAFLRLLGEGGYVARWFPTGSGQPWLPPFGNVLVLHTYSFGIYTYAFASAALENLDQSHEEAARSLGGGRWAVLRHALWPALKAPVTAAALLTFMAAGASYSAPLLLDTSGCYLTVEIVNEKLAGDRAFVAALTALLAGISLTALPPFLFFQRHATAGGGLKGSTLRPLPRARGAGLAVRLALSAGAAAVLLAPLLITALGAFTPKSQWYTGTNLADLTLDAFRGLNDENWAALKHSLGYAGAAAAIDVLLAVAIALALRRAPGWSALPAEACVLLAVALPGTAIAIALLSAFHAGSWLTGGLPLGQTALILILAYAVRCLPLAVRPARAALQDLGTDLERAARGLGAGSARTLLKVTLPLMIPALLAAGLLCFITSAGEFVASELLYGPETVPASVEINTLFRNNPPGATALGLYLMGIGALAVGLAAWIQKRTSWRGRTGGDKL